MSNTPKRLHDESNAQHQIRNRLAPLVTLIELMDSLYDRAINAIADHPRPGAAAKVGFILTNRLSNDLRVCSLTSQLGYGLQALVLAGTIVELVGALSYVGDSDSRAVSWAEHTDRRRTYPPRVDGIEAALSALGFSNPVARKNWQQAYEFMCMAKHANPFLSLLYGMRIFPSGPYYMRGPDSSDLGMYMSAQALYNTVGFGTAGIYVAALHCSDNTLQTQFRTEARSIRDRLLGLEPWFLEVLKPESRPGLKIQKEASALLSVAQRLQSDTESLQRETERIKQETRHLKQETKKIRRTRSGRRSPSS